MISRLNKFGFWALCLAFLISSCTEYERNNPNDPRSVDYHGSLLDSRDGQVYKIVAIGDQVWMAENLNYAASESVCYDNADSNCAIYGRYYSWATAMAGASSSDANPSGVQGVCPSGWHLPSGAELDVLMRFVQTDNGSTYTNGGNASIAGFYLKARNGWDSYRGEDGNGEDKYGFAALPGGFGQLILFSSGDSSYYFTSPGFGYWWSSREHYNDRDKVYAMMMSYESGIVSILVTDNYHLYNVRCVQD
jgi:uncharacterized protein (TIGR02145 family)